MTVQTLTGATRIWRGGYTYRADRPALWAMYRQAFTDIDGLALQRHLMTRDEFGHAMSDDRVTKHLAHRGEEWVGQAVITNQLDAWPLISPRYFQRRWPDHYQQRRIYYVGYVCTTPDAPITTFRDLIADMGQQVFDCDGIAVMDFCTANVLRNLPRATTHILTRLDERATPEHLDSQEFWAWRFDGPGGDR